MQNVKVFIVLSLKALHCRKLNKKVTTIFIPLNQIDDQSLVSVEYP